MRWGIIVAQRMCEKYMYICLTLKRENNVGHLIRCKTWEHTCTCSISTAGQRFPISKLTLQSLGRFQMFAKLKTENGRRNVTSFITGMES